MILIGKFRYEVVQKVAKALRNKADEIEASSGRSEVDMRFFSEDFALAVLEALEPEETSCIPPTPTKPIETSEEKDAGERTVTTTEARDLRARVGDFTSITDLIGRDRHGNRRRARKSSGPRHWGYWA